MKKSLEEKIGSYSVPAEAAEIIKKTKIIFLVGIWGVGKNTVLRKLLEKPEYKFIVSHTTRKPRYNEGVLEKEGVEYHFIDHHKLEEMLDNHDFVEAKPFSGNFYGTSISELKSISESKKIAITEIEIQGVWEYKSISKEVIAIFLLPPDYQTWQKRLMARYGKSGPNPEDMKNRLDTAKKELSEALSKDYYEFVINDDLDRAVRAVDEIVHGSTSIDKNEKAKKIARDLLKKLED